MSDHIGLEVFLKATALSLRRGGHRSGVKNAHRTLWQLQQFCDGAS